MLTIFTHHLRAEIIVTVLPAAQSCCSLFKQQIIDMRVQMLQMLTYMRASSLEYLM